MTWTSPHLPPPPHTSAHSHFHVRPQATLHPGSRTDAGAALSTMLTRGPPSEVTAAACVLSYMARGNKGRDVILSDGLVEPLVSKALAAGPAPSHPLTLLPPRTLGTPPPNHYSPAPAHSRAPPALSGPLPLTPLPPLTHRQVPLRPSRSPPTPSATSASRPPSPSRQCHRRWDGSVPKGGMA
jgi:hypothetical protein